MHGFVWMSTQLEVMTNEYIGHKTVERCSYKWKCTVHVTSCVGVFTDAIVKQWIEKWNCISLQTIQIPKIAIAAKQFWAPQMSNWSFINANDFPFYFSSWILLLFYSLLLLRLKTISVHCAPCICMVHTLYVTRITIVNCISKYRTIYMKTGLFVIHIHKVHHMSAYEMSRFCFLFFPQFMLACTLKEQ